jgi:hypothetical protein
MMSDHEIKLQKAYMLVVLIEKYYETDGAGGWCHIILDDRNYGEEEAKSCITYSINGNDYWGEHIARLLSEFNNEEQEQIVERPWEITSQIF